MHEGRPPLLSIVVPLYNKAATVNRAIDSIFLQGGGDFEVLVVDDGSTDGGADLVERRSNPNLRVFRQANGGVSLARNRGIREASGEWIGFLDADDYFAAGWFRAVRSSIKCFPQAGAIYGKVRVARDNVLAESVGESRTTTLQDRQSEYIDDYLAHVVYENGDEMTSSSVVIRRSVLEQTGGFPVGVRVGEDLDLWFRVGVCTGVVFVKSVVAIYDISQGSSGWERVEDFDPSFVRTYERLMGAGQISDSCADSARAYVNRYYLDKALRAVLCYRSKRLALRFLARVRWRNVPLRQLKRTLFAVVAPSCVWGALVRLRGKGTYVRDRRISGRAE